MRLHAESSLELEPSAGRVGASVRPCSLKGDSASCRSSTASLPSLENSVTWLVSHALPVPGGTRKSVQGGHCVSVLQEARRQD